MNARATAALERAAKRGGVDVEHPFAMDAEEYHYLCAINWRNAHSRRLQDALGDKELVVGFDASYEWKGERVGVWLFAQLCKRYVIEHIGRREVQTEVIVPVIFSRWDEGGRPLPITHPGLLEAVRFARFRKQTGSRQQMKEQRAREAAWRKESRDRERYDQAKDIFPAFRRWADGVLGFVGREGPGGQRKHFYRGCLQP